MMSTAARKQKVIVPALEDRVRALMQELNEILDQLAEVRGGHCLCRSYLAIIEDN
jgi:hypothetical protein